MKGNSSVEDLLRRVARRIGRAAEDADPYIETLRQNWYDDSKSLSGVDQEDLLALGLPLRIAKELLAEVSGGKSGGRGYLEPRKGKDSDKGKDKGKEKGKDREKGKGKSRPGFDAFSSSAIIKAAPAKGKSKGKGKSKKGDGEAPTRTHDIPIATEGVEEDFPWKNRILGEYRKNASHVQKETGVQVWLSGKGVDDTDGSLTLTITSGDSVSDGDFDRAVEMCEDLLEHVYTEAAGWAGADDDEPEKGRKGKGKGKSKDKGKRDGKGKDKGKEKKGKGRSWDDQGPEAKRRK